MKNKKGVVEIQFNWIFILIAGAVILLFFGYLVTQIRGTAEEKTSTTVLSNLETILTGAGISTGTLNQIKLPKAEIEISCERFAIGSLRRPIESDVIFAPRKIKGRDLYTWTLEWAIPYRVTNFLYLTSPLVRYVLVFDGVEPYTASGELMYQINQSLPEEINKEVVRTGGMADFPTYISIQDLNNYEVRFIFFNIDMEDPPASLEDMDDRDVTALQIGALGAEITDINSPAEVKFYQKDDDIWGAAEEVEFLAEPSIFGAIFSDDKEDYECNMRKAFRRLVHVSEVYEQRSTELSTYGTSANCWSYHDQSVSALSSTITQAQSGFIDSVKSTIYTNIQTLEQLNNWAELSSCVLIY